MATRLHRLPGRNRGTDDVTSSDVGTGPEASGRKNSRSPLKSPLGMAKYMVRPTMTGSTTSPISNAVTWVTAAVLGVSDWPTLDPESNRNWPCRLNNSSTFENATLAMRKLILRLPALRSMGSESTTVCTDSGQNRSYESAADVMTFSSASSTSRLRNKLTFWMVDPTKLGFGAVKASPATRPAHANF